MPRRFLYVSNSVSHPPNVGGHQRTNLILRALAAMGEVDLLLLLPEHDIPEGGLEAMRRAFPFVHLINPARRGEMGPWRLIRPFSPRLVDRLAHNLGSRAAGFRPEPRIAGWIGERLRSHRYDLALGRYLQITSRSGVGAYTPTVLDIDDLETEVYRSRLHSPGLGRFERFMLARHLRQLERLVPAALDGFDHLWIASDADRALVGRRPVSVVPNIPYFEPGSPLRPLPPDDASNVVTIIATWNHGPNIDGLVRFLDRSWPLVLARHPAAVLHICGARITDGHRADWAARPGVRVIGKVPRVEDAYLPAALSIAPIHHGGGTKIKVLESLALGRACVLTRHSQRGYEHLLRHGESLWVGDTDEDLAEGCVALLKDPARRRAMAQRGGEIVARHFSFSAIESEVRSTVERLTADGAGLRPRRRPEA
ncbi:MAG: glycosyltransferase [Phycisphaerales bacterium]|nr:glycosyltransferase [Phycisphaerales bacterium]